MLKGAAAEVKGGRVRIANRAILPAAGAALPSPGEEPATEPELTYEKPPSQRAGHWEALASL
jgi:hypothetical protein